MARELCAIKNENFHSLTVDKTYSKTISRTFAPVGSMRAQLVLFVHLRNERGIFSVGKNDFVLKTEVELAQNR